MRQAVVRGRLRLDKTHPLARRYLGLLLLKRGDHEEAISHLTKCAGTAAPATEGMDVVLTILRRHQLFGSRSGESSDLKTMMGVMTRAFRYVA